VPATVARLLVVGLLTAAGVQLPAGLPWRAAAAAGILAAGWWLTFQRALTLAERSAVLRTVRPAPDVASNLGSG
jgi:hypothetical protein